jgi:DNA-binding NarL/FixJ family response regulator
MTDLPIRVAVISRNHLVRAGLVSLIAQLAQRAVVTQAATVDDHLEPHDVAIYDLGADRGRNDYINLQRLRDEGSQVIGLVYDTERDTVQALVGATSHVITLSVTPEQLLEVLYRTTSPRGRQHRGDDDVLRLPARLTEQEFRVLELIGAGLTNPEIAKDLHLSVNSVKTYVRMAYRKIGATNRAGAILWGIEHGLAGGPDRR